MNKNNPIELNCQLHCKASVKVIESVIDDLREEDKSLADILGKEDNDPKETTKNNTADNH